MKNHNPVIGYYRTLESRLGYRWLRGIKHFGYYPEGQEGISMRQAQMNMNGQLAERLSLSAGSKVLDAGCGEGGVAIYLAENCRLQVTGVDLLDFNIARANRAMTAKKLEKLTHFQIGDYTDRPFEDNSFDGIYTMETLVHAPDYKKALNEFYRVLKPGGKLVLFEYSLPNPRDVAPQDQQAYANMLEVNRISSMTGFNEFYHDTFPDKLGAAEFVDITVEDITQRILPMLAEFARIARKPYKLIKLLHLQSHFVNAMSAVEFYDSKHLWRYNIVTSKKARQ